MSLRLSQKLKCFSTAGVIGALLALEISDPSNVALAKNPMVGGAPMYVNKTIIENAVNSKDHTTLVAAVKAAGLLETLSGPGPYTIFAPTNEAFKKLPAGTVDNLLKPENKGQLKAVLTYLVVPGLLSSADLVDQIKLGGGKATLKTIQGEPLTAQLKGKSIEIVDANGNIASVVISNIQQSNGYIQVVDHVPLPRIYYKAAGGTIDTIESFFPWPPPQPSASYIYPRSAILGGRKDASLLTVSQILDSALDAKGYTDRQYFLQISGQGFVTVTRMERIEDSGLSATSRRWDTTVKMNGFSLSQYMEALSGKLQGHFRVFVLIVSKDRSASSSKPMTMDLLNEWKARGVRSLPPEFVNIAFTDDYSVSSLIYEFERKQDKMPVFLTSENSSLSGEQHMKGAGLSAEMLK